MISFCRYVSDKAYFLSLISTKHIRKFNLYDGSYHWHQTKSTWIESAPSLWCDGQTNWSRTKLNESTLRKRKEARRNESKQVTCFVWKQCVPLVYNRSVICLYLLPIEALNFFQPFELPLKQQRQQQSQCLPNLSALSLIVAKNFLFTSFQLTSSLTISLINRTCRDWKFHLKSTKVHRLSAWFDSSSHLPSWKGSRFDCSPVSCRQHTATYGYMHAHTNTQPYRHLPLAISSPILSIGHWSRAAHT